MRRSIHFSACKIWKTLQFADSKVVFYALLLVVPIRNMISSIVFYALWFYYSCCDHLLVKIHVHLAIPNLEYVWHFHLIIQVMIDVVHLYTLNRMGRDMAYNSWSCDLLCAASSPELYRINLEQVCFCAAWSLLLCPFCSSYITDVYVSWSYLWFIFNTK